MYPQYMCILLYVKFILCDGILWIHCSLECGGNVSSVYVHSAICDTYCCDGISEIYCQLEWGVDVSSVYVHSAICDSYRV